MCGGVAFRAAARSVPMSIVDGSTSPSQELEFELVVVVHPGHGIGGGQDVDVDTAEAMAGFCAVTTGGRFEAAATGVLGLDLIAVPVPVVVVLTATLGSAGRGA